MALTDIHLWEMSTAVSLIPVDYSALPESKAILATRRDFNPSHSRLFTRRVKTLPEWSPVPPSNFFQPFLLCLPEAGPWQAGSSRDTDRHTDGEAGALGKAESQRLVHILAEAWGRSWSRRWSHLLQPKWLCRITGQGGRRGPGVAS